MAGLCAPLSTLRRCPRGHLRMTRGRCGSLLLHRDGLAPSTPCRSPGALRFTPELGHCSSQSARLKRANNRLMRRSKRHLYSITSSVRASSIGERSSPECLQSVEIDDQLKFVRKFDRRVTWRGTFEDLHDVGSRATNVIGEIDAI